MFARAAHKIFIAFIAVLLSLTLPAFAGAAQQQEYSSSPADSALTAQDLRQLVAPVALYPDDLLGQILTASEFPVQITEANQWFSDHEGMSAAGLADAANAQDWDPSVKALVEYPPVLRNLASNLSWTSSLGQAYETHPSAVMNEIQSLRRQALDNGTLRTNSHIRVRDHNGYITITEVYADRVYFPAYNPWLVYGYPIAGWPGWVDVSGCWWNGPGLYFSVGYGISPYVGFGWGWPYWGLNWDRDDVFFHRAPYFERGPFFFHRGEFFEDHNREFEGRRFEPEEGFEGRRFEPEHRGFNGRHFALEPHQGFQSRRFEPDHHRNFIGRQFQLQGPGRRFQGRHFQAAPNRAFQGHRFQPAHNQSFQGRHFRLQQPNRSFGGRHFQPAPNHAFHYRHFQAAHNRAFQGRHFAPPARSEHFGGFQRGASRGFSGHGRGGFHGGGFHGGGFHGHGGGFHGGGSHGHGGRR